MPQPKRHPGEDTLIPPHGGYRELKSFRLAQLVYDITVRFVDRYIERGSRTRDQMVQAARSGVQNIAEGSQVSGTSKKMEMKLTSVARASLEELRLDYEDFLRQRNLPMLPPQHPILMRFKARRVKTLHEVQAWVAQERARGQGGAAQTHTDAHSRVEPRGAASSSGGSVSVRGGPEEALSSAALAANAALSLLNVCCYLLDRQLAAQAAAFEKDGGFTERLYKRRTARREASRQGRGRERLD